MSKLDPVEREEIATTKECKFCGKLFSWPKYLSTKQWVARFLCGRACRTNWGKGKKRRPYRLKLSTQERFNALVDQSGEDDCWIWKGYRTNGYGRFQVHDKIYLASRIGWELANGPIPKGLLVCHHCDNPPCVNPKHLFLGTYKDNIHDMLRKGRSHWQQRNRYTATS